MNEEMPCHFCDDGFHFFGFQRGETPLQGRGDRRSPHFNSYSLPFGEGWGGVKTKNTPLSKIKDDMQIPAWINKDQKTKASIPEGTLMRYGSVNGRPSNTQYDIVGFDDPEIHKTIDFQTIEGPNPNGR